MSQQVELFYIGGLILNFGALSLYTQRWGMWLLANVIAVGLSCYIWFVDRSNVSDLVHDYAEFSFLLLNMLVFWLTYLLSDLDSSGIHVIRGGRLKTNAEMNRESKSRSKCHVKLGEVKIPLKQEGLMMMIIGETGSGKTQAILSLSQQIRKRKDRFIAFDPAGDLMRYLYKKEDLIFCPGDSRSIKWSPFGEISVRADCLLLAEGLIESQEGESRSWYQNAQKLLSDILWVLYQTGKRKNSDLLHAVDTLGVPALAGLLKNTPSARLFEKGADKQLASVLSIISTNLRALGELDPASCDKDFSIKSFVRDRQSSVSLWVPYADLTASLTAPIRRCWSRLIIRTLLNKSDESLPLKLTWVILDELASNGAVDDIQLATARGRKYGLSVVAALQSTAQLNQVYGYEATKSLLSNFGNMLVLRSPEESTAKQLSAAIGKHEISRKVSRSNGVEETDREMREIVLPSEIMNLPNLIGYFKLSESGWTRIKLPVVSKRLIRVAESFIPEVLSEEKQLGESKRIDHVDFDEI